MPEAAPPALPRSQGCPSTPRRVVFTVSGLEIEVLFKAIKQVHVSVHPPEGRVRVTAPAALDLDAVRIAVIGRLAWIKNQRRQLAAVERLTPREMVTGESHYLWGRRHRLQVVERDGRAGVSVSGDRIILRVRPGTTGEDKAAIYGRWERRQLRARLPLLIDHWETVMGTSIAAWGTRRMKTKWGSYSQRSGRVWLNTELVKKPPRCLEYVVAHEVAHSIERGHGETFIALMDEHLSDWRHRQHELDNAPLSAENWPD